MAEQLTPVEGSPFERRETLTPVEGNPFENQPSSDGSAGLRSFSDRLSTGLSRVAPWMAVNPRDVYDVAAEGAHTAMEGARQLAGTAPSGMEETGPLITQRLREAGASPEEAQRESDRLMRTMQRNQGIGNMIMGPLQAVTSPLLGAFRSMVSRPIEEAGGFPKELTESLSQVALAGLTMRGIPHTVARVRIEPTGEVSAQPIGTLPTEADFANGARALGSEAAETRLRALWEDQGIHPAEAVNDAQHDAFLRRELTKPNALSADISDAPTLAEQPTPRPGAIMTAAHEVGNKMLDIGRGLQMMLSPMATGSRDAMATAKDFANTIRRNRWEWARIDEDIATRFTSEQRERMWNAADEESVARQLGESREHQGLVTLTDVERAAVEDLQSRAQTAWLRAVDMGMVEGEGLPAYTPRMIINAARSASGEGPIPLDGIGTNLRTRTPNMRHRKYMTAEETEAAARSALGDEASLARDIRTLPLATARMEDAIAGRTLIDQIKEAGKRTGEDTVAEGSIPGKGWFTIDHPAFRTWRPKFAKDEATGAMRAVTDADGNAVFEQVPIYVHSDFEGPLRATLAQRDGAPYSAFMEIKGKTMGLIMNSPMIHNAVEWGRALPAMPGKVASFKIYFEGNRAKHDVAIMHEAIDAGLVPIGKRFFNQDITSIMEEPNLTPGRSWTAQVAAFIPGLFDEGAGIAVKKAIDKAGDFWHNTLLWDRIADLQMGLYTNLRASAMEKGIDPQTASRMAAHWANRYAGALPQEAMSASARKISNVLLFSRSFTMGNLGVMKDVLTGLPRDVIAQIERDAGFRAGSINEAGAMAGPEVEAVQFAKTMARRKAMAVVALDMGLFYIGNSMLQTATNVLLNDSTLEREFHGYTERLAAMMTKVKEHPLSLLQPLQLLGSLSSTHENEPSRQDRVHVGYAADGTAIYARAAPGKLGEEFQGWLTGPLDMIRRKLGTIARPAWQIMSNDRGFGRKVYDPGADTPAKYLKNLGLIAAHLVGSQLPEGQLNAAADLVRGQGDPKVNALQAFGPIAGVTFSKGAPGGPAVGEMYAARGEHQFAVDAALPDIRRQIQRGDLAGATDRMNELGIAPGLQRFYVRTSLNPATRLSGRTLRDFYRYSTPEQQRRLLNAPSAPTTAQPSP